MARASSSPTHRTPDLKQKPAGARLRVLCKVVKTNCWLPTPTHDLCPASHLASPDRPASLSLASSDDPLRTLIPPLTQFQPGISFRNRTLTLSQSRTPAPPPFFPFPSAATGLTRPAIASSRPIPNQRGHLHTQHNIDDPTEPSSCRFNFENRNNPCFSHLIRRPVPPLDTPATSFLCCAFAACNSPSITLIPTSCSPKHV